MQIEIRNAQNLSFREKQVVTLKETGASTATIAKRLGLSESTVTTLYSRARTKGYETVIVLPGDVLGLYGGEDPDDE